MDANRYDLQPMDHQSTSTQQTGQHAASSFASPPSSPGSDSPSSAPGSPMPIPPSTTTHFGPADFVLSEDAKGKYAPLINVFCKKEMGDLARLSHTRAVTPVVHQWLLDMFELAEDSTITKDEVYRLYTLFSDKLGIKPLIPSSFGKLVKAAFGDLKVRRLGTRKESKYHYIGLRMRAGAIPYSEASTAALAAAIASAGASGADEIMVAPGAAVKPTTALPPFSDLSSAPAAAPAASPAAASAAAAAYMQAKAAALSGISLPNPSLRLGDSYSDLPGAVGIASASGGMRDPALAARMAELATLYREHSTQLIKCVVTHNFGQAAHILNDFWGRIAWPFMGMLQTRDLADQLLRYDELVYAHMADALVPHVLEEMPVSIVQNTRQFAAVFSHFIEQAVKPLPPDFAARKIAKAQTFFYRVIMVKTSLNIMSQHVRHVISSKETLSKIIYALGSITPDPSRVPSGVEFDDRGLLMELKAKMMQLLEEGRDLKVWQNWVSQYIEQSSLFAAWRRERTPSSMQVALFKWYALTSMITQELYLSANWYDPAATVVQSAYAVISTLLTQLVVYTLEECLKGPQLYPQGSQASGAIKPPPAMLSSGVWGTSVPLGPGDGADFASAAFGPDELSFSKHALHAPLPSGASMASLGMLAGAAPVLPMPASAPPMGSAVASVPGGSNSLLGLGAAGLGGLSSTSPFMFSSGRLNMLGDSFFGTFPEFAMNSTGGPSTSSALSTSPERAGSQQQPQQGERR